MGFRALLLILGLAASTPAWAQPETGSAAGGRIVNRQRSVRHNDDLIFYRYKGVDLPLKSFEEIRGNHPLIRIVDGRNTLWVAEARKRTEVLDRILAAELDAMTHAGDDLYFGGRFPAALAAYERIYDVITRSSGPEDLESYPAVRAYLLLRMGQCHSWMVKTTYEQATSAFDDADVQDAHADEVRSSRTRAHMTDYYEAAAGRLRKKAEAYLTQADAHRKTARALFRRALDAHRRASHGNAELFQAQNELGILDFWQASDALVAGDTQSAERLLGSSIDLFEKARAASRGQEYVLDNLVAAHATLADIHHGRGDFDEALREVERAMAVLPSPEPIIGDDEDGARVGAADSFLVSFKSYHPAVDEEIVVLAPLEAGLVAKYLTIQRDKEEWPAAVARAKQAGADPVWELWRDVGRQFLAAKDYDSAAAFYEGLNRAYLTGDSEAPDGFRDAVAEGLVISFRRLGEQLYEKKRYDAAVALYQRALQYVPNSEVLSSGFVTAAIGQADDALADGQWEDALARLVPLKKIYTIDESAADADKLRILDLLDTRLAAAHLGLSSRELAAGKLDTAAAHADAAVELDPDRRDFQEARARVLAAYARRAEAAGPSGWDTAKDYYDQAIAAGPFLPKLRLASGSLVVRMKVRDTAQLVSGFFKDYGVILLVFLLGLVVAIPLGRAAVSETGRRRRVRVLRSKGIKAYNEKRWHDAVTALSEYRRQLRGPVPEDILEILARSYRRIGDYESALRHFDLAGARSRRTYHLERCEIYIVRRNLPLAVQALRTSQDLAGDVERMLEFVQQLRKSEGKHAFFREAMGALQLVGGDPDEARLNYKRLHDTDPENPRYVRQLLAIAQTTHDDRGVERWLEMLVRIDPADATSRRKLADLLLERGEYPRAVDLLEESQEIQPLHTTAEALERARLQLEQAEVEAEIALLQSKPPHPKQNLRLAELYLKVDQPDKARQLLNRLADDPEHGLQASRLLGLMAHSERQWAEAVRLLRNYLSRRPNLEPNQNELEARYHLGLSHEGLGQHELAAVQYQAIYDVDHGYRDVAQRLRHPRFASRSLPGATDDDSVNPESGAIRELDVIELGGSDEDDDSITVERVDPDLDSGLELADDEDTKERDED